MQRVLILGESGFVGKAICRELLKLGAEVYSISRSGNPNEGLDGVHWIKGNALDKSVYDQVANIDTLIHSIGILAEPRTKKSSRETYPVTFESEITETLAVALKSPNVLCSLKRIGYISTADYGTFSHFFLPKYMKAKNAAEALMASQNVPSVVARPGFMFGRDRPASIPVSWAHFLMTLFTAGLFPPALDVNKMAQGFISALADDSLKGVRILEARDFK